MLALIFQILKKVKELILRKKKKKHIIRNNRKKICRNNLNFTSIEDLNDLANL